MKRAPERFGALPGRVPFRHLRTIGAVALAITLLASVAAGHDPELMRRFMLGGSSAVAACDGLDSSNTYRARLPLPADPEMVFRVRVPGGVGQPPSADPQGNLIVLHGEPRLSKLDAAGHSLWSQRLPSEASTGPILTNDGRILVITRDAEALLFSDAGKLEQRHALPVSDARRRTFAIPSASGGALLACGSDLLQLDPDARISRQARARQPIASLAESGPDWVAIGENGSVEIAHTSGDFELIGSFPGSVPEGAALEDGKVFAIVEGHHWMSLDLHSGLTATLARDASATFSGPAALLGGHNAALVLDGGFVSLRGRDGSELSRVAINPAGQGFDLAQRALRSALLIGDERGRVLAVRSGLDAILIRPDAAAVRLEGTSCLDPFRPTPTGKGLVLACRSGQIFAFKDHAR